MDWTVFAGAGRPLGLGIAGMLALSVLGAAVGVWLPRRALRQLREESGGDRRFDPDGTLGNKVLVFQAAAGTGACYGFVAAFFLAMQCGAFAMTGQMAPAVTAAAPALLTALAVLGGANLVGGVLKGVLAGRQLEHFAWEPDRFGRCYVKALAPEVLQILGLVYLMLRCLTVLG